ncbi:MAG: hypothetical protein Q4C96_03545 [Planctomycetia bacterium]|nr:hypothetical protein [Planctomycetia bacterium]
MNFRFSLSTVQKIHENQREQHQMNFADALKKMEIIIQQIQSLDTQLKNLRLEKEAFLRMSGTLSFTTFLAYEQREKWLLEELNRQRARCQEIQNETEKCRSAVMDADIQVKMLEKLEEKQRMEYIQDEKKSLYAA